MKVLAFLFLLVTAISLQAECTLNKQTLLATYHLKNTKELKQTFKLWRYQGKVAHQYLDKNITEVWEKTPNQKIRPIRYFDAFKRAIEYQPHDIRHHTQDYWSEKYQLLDADYRAQFTLLNTEGEGCKQKQIYSLKQEGIHYRLTWLPALDLVESYRIETADKIKIWALDKIEFDTETISYFFTERDNYQSTDFIDIGDNENDPFLLKMINVGFKRTLSL